MANHKSAKKRARQTLKRTFVNKARLTRARSAIQALRSAIAKGDQALMSTQLRKVQGLLARTHLSSQSIARKTSRLTRLVIKSS